MSKLNIANQELSEEIKNFTEKLRLKKLYSYKILDTDPDQAFDDIVSLASFVCNTPIAAISFIDGDRQWIKAKVGDLGDAGNVPREESFCNVAIKTPDKKLIVTDASKHPLFKDLLPTTGHPHVRFYVGVPLVAPTGEALGALCVIDQKPRKINDEQAAQLDALARLVIKLLEIG